jgi:predicted outer membrane repeat protein
MDDESSVSGNQAVNIGAIFISFCFLSLHGTSSVSGNDADTNNGGGIYSSGGDVDLFDSSSVSNNRAAEHGGGIFCSGGTLWMHGASSVRRNMAGESGGGIYNAGTVLVGAVAGGNVSDNVPDDIFP